MTIRKMQKKVNVTQFSDVELVIALLLCIKCLSIWVTLSRHLNYTCLCDAPIDYTRFDDVAVSDYTMRNRRFAR